MSLLPIHSHANEHSVSILAAFYVCFYGLVMMWALRLTSSDEFLEVSRRHPMDDTAVVAHIEKVKFMEIFLLLRCILNQNNLLVLASQFHWKIKSLRWMIGDRKFPALHYLGSLFMFNHMLLFLLKVSINKWNKILVGQWVLRLVSNMPYQWHP